MVFERNSKHCFLKSDIVCVLENPNTLKKSPSQRWNISQKMNLDLLALISFHLEKIITKLITGVQKVSTAD